MEARGGEGWGNGTGDSPRPGEGGGADRLPDISELAQLEHIVSRHGEVYLRHSLGPAADSRENSRDYESGLPLPGLSAVPLRPPDWWHRPAADWLARQICKYAHLTEADDRRFAWVLTGRVRGTGPDMEPLVVAPRPLGRLGDRVLKEARHRYEQCFEVGRESAS